MIPFLVDYIKAIENPNKIGWNGKVWNAPNLKGYDKNQRGYGIDIRYNREAKELTKNRPGLWITENEANTLMNNHLKYIEGVAKRKIKGFDNFSREKLAAILGMLYRGDSVQSNVNINEPDDMKFLDSVHTYYKSKGLNERALNSEKFLNKMKRNVSFTQPIIDYTLSVDNTRVEKPIITEFKKGGQIRKMLTAAGGALKAPLVKINGKWIGLQSQGNGNLTASGRLFLVKTKPTNALGNNMDLVVTPRKKATVQSTPKLEQLYRSAFDPNAPVEFINAMTAGGFNNLSPTQWARRAYDAVDLMKGNISQEKYINSWINGNNGIVTDKFAQEHPYWSMGINMAGDAATLGGIVKGSKILFRTSKPKINVLDNSSSTSSVSLTPALSQEQIEKAFELARLWHLNRINSPGYTNRALRAGFTEEEIPLLQLQLVSLINRLKLLNPEKLFEKVNIKHNYNGKTNAGYWKTINNEGKLLLGIRFNNPNMSYDDAVSTFVHEFGHGATFGLNGNETTGYMKLLSDLFPLLTRAVKYNKTLYPEVNENIVTQVMPKVGNNAKYFADPSEILSRGYEFMRDYANNFFKLKNSEGLTTQNVIDNAANTRINSKIFRALTGNLGAFNFLKYALGTAAPIGLGYNLMNNNENQLQLQYQKLGGKMNTIEFLKNGSGIHIKKKNRGKFTSYCGGEVTNECILRGKKSSNPAIRKRATFADNARHFKHRLGGSIVEAFKLRRLILNSLNNMIND